MMSSDVGEASRALAQAAIGAARAFRKMNEAIESHDRARLRRYRRDAEQAAQREAESARRVRREINR